MSFFELIRDKKFYQLLTEFDEELADEAADDGCRVCAAAVHRAPYPRKPRGGPDLPGYTSRESFCCSVKGCRKRLTPPSLRFLGRKVYLGAVVVLVSAMMHGVTPDRLAKLQELTGVSRRTVDRWRVFWRESFAASPFWKAEAGRFDRPVERDLLPLSLLERFVGSESDRLVAMLRFLSPITTRSARKSMAF